MVIHFHTLLPNNKLYLFRFLRSGQGGLSRGADEVRASQWVGLATVGGTINNIYIFFFFDIF